MPVYHFLPQEWALDDLKNKRLKVATFDDLNDPFELLCFNMTNPTDCKRFDFIKQYAISNTGILCFSREWKNPLLWSHYANKHYGVCLGFEVPADKLITVNYTEVRPAVNWELPEQEIAESFLSTKFDGWNYEKEMRCFLPLATGQKDASTGHYFTDFGPSLKLQEIIIGPLSNLTELEIKPLIYGIENEVKVTKTRIGLENFEVVQA